MNRLAVFIIIAAVSGCAVMNTPASSSSEPDGLQDPGGAGPATVTNFTCVTNLQDTSNVSSCFDTTNAGVFITNWHTETVFETYRIISESNVCRTGVPDACIYTGTNYFITTNSVTNCAGNRDITVITNSVETSVTNFEGVSGVLTGSYSITNSALASYFKASNFNISNIQSDYTAHLITTATTNGILWYCESNSTCFSIVNSTVTNWVSNTERCFFSYMDSNGSIVITGYSADWTNAAACDKQVMAVPAYIDDKPVRAVKPYSMTNNPALISLQLPDTLLYIGTAAFAYCSNLYSLSLGAGVTNIDRAAFLNSTYGMTVVTIPASVKFIGMSCFHNSAYTHIFTTVYCNPVQPPVIELTPGMLTLTGPFGNAQKVQKIKVPAGSVSAYTASACWSVYKNNIMSQ